MLSLERDKEQIKKTHKTLKYMAQGMSETEAMIEAQYQDALANNPAGITETDAWRLVMASALPDMTLAKRHRALLDKVDHTGQPDTQAVSKALELAYKIKGKLVDRVDHTTNGESLPAQIVFNFPKKSEYVQAEDSTEFVQNDINDIL